MILWWLLNALIMLVVILETCWFVVYWRGPWGSSPIGWVWLLKGSALIIVFGFLLVNQFWHVPVYFWIGIAALLNLAIGLWLRATILALRGDLTVFQRSRSTSDSTTSESPSDRT